jgi:thiol-disulfide isomerase/thioredoxin
MLRLSSWDVFRKLPKDLTHGTSHGGVLSVLAVLLIGLVFLFELWTYLAGEVQTSVMLDTNREQLLQINFKLTMMRLPCEFASVDVWDYLGNNRLDLTKNIHKTMVSGPTGEKVLGAWDDGMAFGAGGTIEEHNAAVDSVVHPQVGLDECDHIDGEEDFNTKLAGNAWSFVDFYAPWCIHCVRLSPTWEAFAKTIHDRDFHVKVYKVDCTKNAFLCRSQQVTGYPTLRVYKGVQAMSPDFLGKRTVHTLLDWMESMTNEHAHVQKVREHKEEGCLILGTVWVNRVPGNFHVTAKSGTHDFDPKTTNVSHVVHHFSFGPALPSRVIRHLPPDVSRNINPLDGRTFVSDQDHVTHEHYIKIVSTHYRVGKDSLFNRGDSLGYQMATSNHRYFADPAVPEAKFSFDLSPTAVVIIQGGKRWYEFVTSLCAIVGGVFTVISLLDGAVYNIAKQVKGAQGKLS